jgi:hypothetical protein
MAKVIYRIGPIMVLAFVIVFSLAWGLATNPTHENDTAWYGGPMLGCLVLVPLWHFALIVTERGRRIAYVAYALGHLPVFAWCWLMMVMLGSHIYI